MKGTSFTSTKGAVVSWTRNQSAPLKPPPLIIPRRTLLPGKIFSPIQRTSPNWSKGFQNQANEQVRGDAYDRKINRAVKQAYSKRRVFDLGIFDEASLLSFFRPSRTEHPSHTLQNLLLFSLRVRKLQKHVSLDAFPLIWANLNFSVLNAEER